MAIELRRSNWLIFCALLLVGVTGCAVLDRARGGVGVERAAGPGYRSGFFESYAGLEPVGERGALFAHVNPEADLAAYDKVILGRIHIWRGSDHEGVPSAELELLAHRIHQALSAALVPSYSLVERPGPGTMRLSFGFTQAPEATPAMQCYHTDVAASPVEPVSQTLSKQASDFLVGAVAEAEFTDSRSGEVLSTLLDRRLENNAREARMGSWLEVDVSLRHMAGRLRTALARLQEEYGGAR